MDNLTVLLLLTGGGVLYVLPALVAWGRQRELGLARWALMATASSCASSVAGWP